MLIGWVDRQVTGRGVCAFLMARTPTTVMVAI